MRDWKRERSVMQWRNSNTIFFYRCRHYDCNSRYCKKRIVNHRQSEKESRKAIIKWDRERGLAGMVKGVHWEQTVNWQRLQFSTVMCKYRCQCTNCQITMYILHEQNTTQCTFANWPKWNKQTDKMRIFFSVVHHRCLADWMKRRKRKTAIIRFF